MNLLKIVKLFMVLIVILGLTACGEVNNIHDVINTLTKKINKKLPKFISKDSIVMLENQTDVTIIL